MASCNVETKPKIACQMQEKSQRQEQHLPRTNNSFVKMTVFAQNLAYRGRANFGWG